MNEEIKKDRIKRFVADEIMFVAVRDMIETEIAKPSSDRDVQNLAAKMIAIEILNHAWNELEKFKVRSPEDESKKMQIGL